MEQTARVSYGADDVTVGFAIGKILAILIIIVQWVVHV